MTKKTKPEKAPIEENVLENEIESETVEIEVEPEVQIDAAEETIPTPEPVVVQKKGGFSVLVGGVIAAVLGFSAAQFVPDGWPLAVDRKSDFEAQLLEQAQEISALKDNFAVQAEALDEKLDGAELAREIAVLSQATTLMVAKTEEGIVANHTRLDGLSARLTDLEKRPIADSADPSGAVAAYERELAELKNTLDVQKVELEAAAKEAEAKIAQAQSQAESLQAGAEATANAALIRAGMSNVASALEAGGSFQAALEDVTQATDNTPTSELTAASLSGVETLANLRKSFPAAARRALSAPGMEAKDGGTFDRLGAFVRSQTGARSLSPREGGDPDAILSRAEAAVGVGDLTGALEEIGSLPPVAQEEMVSWTKSATYRLETIAAVEAFFNAVSDK